MDGPICSHTEVRSRMSMPSITRRLRGASRPTANRADLRAAPTPGIPTPSATSQNSPARCIAMNFAALSMAEVGCRAVSMIVTLTLAQRLGRDGYGRIEFAFNVVFWLVLLVREGLDVIATREIARHPRLIRPLVNYILAIRGCLALVLMTGLIIAGRASLSEPADRMLLALYGLMLWTTAVGVDFVYRGLERMRLLAISLLVRTLVYAVGAALWVTSPDRVLWVPLWLVTGEVCGIALVWGFYLRDFGVPRPTLHGTRALRTILRRGQPVYLIQVSQAVIGSADLVVVGLMSQWADVGLYGVPHRMVAAILTFGVIFRQVVFPSLARSWRASPAEGRAALDSMVRVLMLAMVPIAVGSTVLADPLIDFLLSPEYRGSGTLLALGIWRVPLLTLAFLYQSALIALNREAAGVRMLMAGAAVVGPLAALLRWTSGLEGAATGMLIVGLGLLFAGYRRLAVEKRAPAWHHHIGRPLLGSLAMVPVCLLLSQISVVLAVAGGAAVYAGMIIFLSGLQPTDLRVLSRR
jgi:O-antigen/teichoic acid export membrane protein